MENSKTILEKIKKMLAHQQSALQMGSIAEAEAFATKIQKLLNKYNLSLLDIPMDKREDEILELDLALKIPSIGSRTNFWIYNAIAKNNWCKAYIIGNNKSNRMILVGTEANVDICKYIHDIVTPIFLKIGKDKYKNEYLPEQEANEEKIVGLDTYMRTFIKGCADGLSMKLAESMKQFVEENENALMVVKGNEAAIVTFVEAKFGKSGNARGSRMNYAGGAYENGVETGKNVQINKGVATSKPIERKMIG